MTEVIAQRDLRNDSADVLRRVEAGEEFIVTRNGTPVAMLVPVARRRAVPRARLLAAFAGAPHVDGARFRDDIDAQVDQALHDPLRR